MKRCFMFLCLLSAFTCPLHADAYRDSLRSFVYCDLKATELSSFVENMKPDALSWNIEASDSLSLLFKEYIQSDKFREACFESVMPYAREYISPQSLYTLLRPCHASTEESKAAIKKEPAYRAAYDLYLNTLDKWQQSHPVVTGLIIMAGYISFLKTYYPNQAIRMNDTIESLKNTEKTEAVSYAEKPVQEPKEPQEEPAFSSRWKVGGTIYFRARHESVPSPEEGDYLYYAVSNYANSIGEIRRISDSGILTVYVYDYKDYKKGRLIAVRNFNDELDLQGRQVDYYPSGKEKRILNYNTKHNVTSIVEKDTLGHIVKKIEGRGNARKEYQYHTNGQLRKEKLGPGPKYDIHCFDKNGQPVRYFEGDLYVYDDGVYVISGEAPSYPGGNDAVSSYARKHVAVPESLSKGVYTTVCSVRVADDGSVDDVRVNMSSGSSELDAEVVRVLKEMPKWTPGKLKKWKFVQNPKDAKVTIIRKRFVIPVTVFL